jgi:hypothetical protein
MEEVEKKIEQDIIHDIEIHSLESPLPNKENAHGTNGNNNNNNQDDRYFPKQVSYSQENHGQRTAMDQLHSTSNHTTLSINHSSPKSAEANSNSNSKSDSRPTIKNITVTQPESVHLAGADNYTETAIELCDTPTDTELIYNNKRRGQRVPSESAQGANLGSISQIVDRTDSTPL